jgi:hypothetical protein
MTRWLIAGRQKVPAPAGPAFLSLAAACERGAREVRAGWFSVLLSRFMRFRAEGTPARTAL